MQSAEGPPGYRTSFEPYHSERPRSAPPRTGWTNPTTPKAEATTGARLRIVPQVRSIQDLTTVTHDTTM